jgi:hypothetical protein
MCLVSFIAHLVIDLDYVLEYTSQKDKDLGDCAYPARSRRSILL